MKHVLLLGAGKTAPYLIEYLLKKGQKSGWQLHIADQNLETVADLSKSYPQAQVFSLDVQDDFSRRRAISQMDLVISLLPTKFHLCVAVDAAATGIDMLTASYAKADLSALNKAFADKGRLLLMEMGLDPGIDHMIAAKIIQQVQEQGHKIHSFEAFTGALLAPNSYEDNPWQYKFTWSPAQIMRAGQEGAQFIQEGALKFIPYHQVFRRIERIHIPGQGYFEGYGNRDSISYRETYGLQHIPTLYRGTLRPLGFCAAWNALMRIGATDSKYEITHLENMTHRDFFNTFLMHHPTDSVELKFAHYMRLDMHAEVIEKIKWLGLFEHTPIGMQGSATAIDILQHIIHKKWQMRPQDQDKVLLWEKTRFTDAETGRLRELQAYLSCTGENAARTAIAKTVGLTLGIAAGLVLEGKLKSLQGLQLPTQAQIYTPVLKELANYGITHQEEEVLATLAEIPPP